MPFASCLWAAPGEYPVEEAVAWGRVLEKLADLEQATRRFLKEE